MSTVLICLLKSYSTLHPETHFYLYFAWLNISASFYNAVLIPIEILSFQFSFSEAGRIQFDAAISRGVSSVDLRYKAANVSVIIPKCPSTLLTAKRSGEAEVLNGLQILVDIENLVRL